MISLKKANSTHLQRSPIIDSCCLVIVFLVCRVYLIQNKIYKQLTVCVFLNLECLIEWLLLLIIVVSRLYKLSQLLDPVRRSNRWTERTNEGSSVSLHLLYVTRDNCFCNTNKILHKRCTANFSLPHKPRCNVLPRNAVCIDQLRCLRVMLVPSENNALSVVQPFLGHFGSE